MDYKVKLPDGTEHTVAITETPDGKHQIKVGDQALKADAHRLGPQSFHTLFKGRSLDIAYARRADRYFLDLDGHALDAEVLDPRRAFLAGASTHSGPQVIAAPMPGRVVAILVSEGEEVTPGQGIAVVEAMKMENELKAQAPGKVEKIHTTPGAAVEHNAPLVTIAPQDP